MNTDLDRALSEIHTEILNLRSLEYVVSSQEFKDLYDQCVNKQEVDFYIQLRDVNAIKLWMQGQRIFDLDAYNVKQLRLMAQRMRIKDYHILTKNLLISEIRKCRQPSSITS